MAGAVTCFVALALGVTPAAAAPPISTPAASPSGSVVVVILDGVTLRELRAASEFMRVTAESGVVGLTSPVRGDDSRLRLGGTLTFSAGSPVNLSILPFSLRGVHEMDESIEAGTALQAWHRRTGLTPGTAEGVVPDIVALSRSNSDASSGVGSLGQVIRDAGMQTAYVGDASVASDPLAALRAGGFVASDTQGLVDIARTRGTAFVVDPKAPFGVRTDYKALASLVASVKSDSGLMVVDLGDLHRASFEARMSSSEAADAQRLRILRDADTFLASLARQASADRLVIFVSLATPAEGDVPGDLLLPVVIFGDGLNAGIAKSPSTRRLGFMVVTDLHDLVLASLGLSPTTVSSLVDSQPNAQALNRLLDIQDSVLQAHHKREPVLALYLMAQQLLLLALALPLWIAWGECPVWTRAIALMPLVTAPLLLLVAVIPGETILLPVVAWVVSVVILALSLATIRDARVAVLLSSLFGIALVGGDLLAGATWQSRSALGYDLVAGGRYYGMGNEYTGVLVGATLLTAAVIVDRWGSDRRVRWTVLVALFAVAGLFALPNVGADLGGALTMLGAAGTFGWVSAGWRPSLAHTLFIGAGFAAVVVAAVTAINLLPTLPASHVSRFLERASQGDLSHVGETVSRKLAANLSIAGSIQWGPVLLVAASALAWLWLSRYRTAGIRTSLGIGTRSGAAAFAVAMGLGLLLNDSGVTSAVTMSAYFAVLLMGPWSHGAETGKRIGEWR